MLKILSFNTWLVRTPLGFDISRDTDKRFQALSDALVAMDADIICLQEVWDPRLRSRLTQSLQAKGYAYSIGAAPVRARSSFPLRFFHSHFGNGLMTFSKLPIVEEKENLTFHQHTRPDEVLTLKGATAVKVRMPTGQEIVVCNAHLGAVSFAGATQSYSRLHVRKRMRQTRELAKWLGKVKSEGALFLAADLNVHFRTWSAGKHSSKMARELSFLLSPRWKGFSFKEAGLTMDVHTPVPKWSFHHKNPYVAEGFFGHLPNEVPDYLFYSSDAPWTPIEFKQVFQHSRLSDHYGLLVKFHSK